MKNFIKIIAVSMFLALCANANDLLFKATNGLVNEKDSGAKVLNDIEMKSVLGGYAFYREPRFDHYGVARSYAYVVLDDYINMNAGAVADEFNLGYNEVMVVKARYDYSVGGYYVYLQVYNFQTNMKVRDYVLDQKGQRILNEFVSLIR